MFGMLWLTRPLVCCDTDQTFGVFGDTNQTFGVFGDTNQTFG